MSRWFQKVELWLISLAQGRKTNSEACKGNPYATACSNVLTLLVSAKGFFVFARVDGDSPQ